MVAGTGVASEVSVCTTFGVVPLSPKKCSLLVEPSRIGPAVMLVSDPVIPVAVLPALVTELNFPAPSPTKILPVKYSTTGLATFVPAAAAVAAGQDPAHVPPARPMIAGSKATDIPLNG